MKKSLSDEIHVAFLKKPLNAENTEELPQAQASGEYFPNKNWAKEMGFVKLPPAEDSSSKMPASIWIVGILLFVLKIVIGIGVLWLWYVGVTSAIIGQWGTALGYIFGGVIISIIARLFFPSNA